MEILKGIVPNIAKDFSSDDEKFNSLLELGETYFRGNEYDKSISAYEKAIKENPKNSGGWLGKALCHLATTEVIGINEVDVKAYLDSALKYGDQSTLEKYLVGVTLFYSYNYAAAIKLLIDQTNKAIAEKKVANVMAVVSLATAVAGGAVANKSKSATGKFIGYGMLTGGAGMTMKKGFDSFKLDQLAKSTYGNALAQTLVSVPSIIQCYRIYSQAIGDLKENTGVIISSWKKSVAYLFQNEKEQLINKLGELGKERSNSDILTIKYIPALLNKSKVNEVKIKLDEILYFMDMVGLDNCDDFQSIKSVKSVFDEFNSSFDESRTNELIDEFKKEKKRFFVIESFLFFLLLMISENENATTISNVFGISIIALVAWMAFKYYSFAKNFESDSGLDEMHKRMVTIIKEVKSVEVHEDEFDLNLLGV